MSEVRPCDTIVPSPRRRGEAGVALLASVLLLLMLASLGLASLNVVQRDQQVAGYLNRKAIALHAADAAVAEALQTLDATGTPTVSNSTLGDGALYPHGQPSYRTDQSVADPIVSVGMGNLQGMGLGIGANASAQFQIQYWRIRVQGEAPGGSLARVEVLTGTLVGN